MGTTGTVLALTSAAVGGAILFYTRRGSAGLAPLDFQGLQGMSVIDATDEVVASTGLPGWKGDPQEYPVKRMPEFPNTTAGHVAFVKWIIPALMQLGLSHESAILFAAHLARETGYGKSIFNYNIGNIKTGTGEPAHPWFWLTDARDHRDKYRWYATSVDGLADDMRLIKTGAGGRYIDAWNMLVAGDPNWYGQLGLDGYYEGPPDPENPARSTRHTPETVAPVQAEYNSIVNNNIRVYETMDTDVPIPSDAQMIPGLPAFAVQPVPVLQESLNVSASPVQIGATALVVAGLGYMLYEIVSGQ